MTDYLANQMCDLGSSPYSDTRALAHESIKPQKHTLQAAIIGLLHIYPRGLTADEAATLLKTDKLAVRPRFSELLAAKSIYDTGRRNKNVSGRRAAVFALENPVHA